MVPNYRISSAGWVGLLCLLLVTASSQVYADPGSLLSGVLRRYNLDTQNLQPGDREERFQFWESQFQQALREAKEPSPARFRMLDELGALQKTLGKPEAALETYDLLIREAEAAKNLANQVIGLENAFQLATRHDAETAHRYAVEYIAALEKQEKSRRPDFPTIVYDNALVQTATRLEVVARDIKEKTARHDVLATARRFLDTAIAIPKEGQTPLVTKYLTLAKVLQAMGERDSALETYDLAADLDQAVISVLWIRKLQSDLWQAGSPEQCEILEKALAHFEQTGQVDEYEITMRHSLGLAYSRGNKHAEAAKTFESIVGKSPDRDMNAYNLLLAGDSYQRLGQREKALQIFRQVIRKYPATGSAQMAKNAIDLAAPQ